MTATDDRVWSEFGLETPERIAEFRAQEKAGADLCRCEHVRRDHHRTGGCNHTAVRYSGSWTYRLPCDCEGFSAVQTPGRGEDG